MLSKILQKISHNMGLKILAAVLAFVLWLAVTNIEDPEKTKMFTIPVTIENADSLSEQGLTFTVAHNSDTVSFYVTGKRTVVDSMDVSDFVATADMSQMVNSSDVPISISAVRYSSQISIQDADRYLQVDVENLVSKQFDIQTDLSGDLATGYVTGESSISPNVLEISGPESVVDRISRVVVSMDLSGVSKDIDERVTPILYDEDGRVVSSERLNFNWDKVSLTVKIYKSIAVPIKAEASGEPAEGARVTGVIPSLSEVSIYGESEDLDGIDEIIIPATLLDVTGLKETVTKDIDLASCLPEGVLLANAETSKITVAIFLESLEDRTFDVPVSNFTVENTRVGYYSKIDGDTVTITINGYPSDLNALNANSITGVIDGSEFNPGSNSGELQLDLDSDKYEVKGTPRVTVNLSTSND